MYFVEKANPLRGGGAKPRASPIKRGSRVAERRSNPRLVISPPSLKARQKPQAAADAPLRRPERIWYVKK